MTFVDIWGSNHRAVMTNHVHVEMLTKMKSHRVTEAYSVWELRGIMKLFIFLKSILIFGIKMEEAYVYTPAIFSPKSLTGDN